MLASSIPAAFPSSDHRALSEQIVSYVDTLSTASRQAFGQYFVDLSQGAPNGPQDAFVKEALRWTGQSIIDGDFNSTPFNITPEAAAAAAVEFGTDALIGAGLATAAVAAFWMLPVAVVLPTSIGVALVGSQLAALTPIFPVVASLVGKLARGLVVDAIKGAFGEDVSDSINGFYNSAGEWLVDTANSILDGLAWSADAIASFARALANQFIRNIDPIILDLDGDGVEFLSSTDITIFFDMDGDGRRERTGWITADDGFLALDANRNGKVDNIDELFGRDGQSGFAELLVLDTNGDRVLDSRDAQWSQLQIWRDLNQNGVGDAGELSNVASYRIASIDLNFTVVNAVASGNLVHEQSTYRLTDGTIRTVVDGWLSVNGALTAYELSDGVPPDIAALPDLRGSGNLLNLRVAAASDPQLKTTLQVFDQPRRLAAPCRGNHLSLGQRRGCGHQRARSQFRWS